MSEIVFRPYRDGDEYAINAGFNEVFGQSRSLAEWHWKFPASGGPRPIMLALDGDGTVLVHYGASEVRIQADGGEYAGGQIVDVYSRQEARHGLAAARSYLRNYARFVETFCGPEKLAFCYGFPGERALRLGLMRTAYDEVPPVPVRLWGRAVGRVRRWPERRRVRLGFDPTAIDRVWAASRQRYGITTVRDARRLAARYLGRPGVEYLHTVVWVGERPGAVAVSRLVAGTLQVAELVWNGQSRADLAALDRALARIAADAGAARMEMWLEGDAAAEETFASLGWRPGPHPLDLRFIVRVFHPGIDRTTVPARLYLTMGDSDLV